jgi:hypothetical protein
MYIRMDRHCVSVGSKLSSTGEAKPRPFDGLERLREDKLLSELHPSFASSNGNMVRPSPVLKQIYCDHPCLLMLCWYTLLLSLMPGVAICFENSRLEQFWSSAINLWSPCPYGGKLIMQMRSASGERIYVKNGEAVFLISPAKLIYHLCHINEVISEWPRWVNQAVSYLLFI